MKNKLSARLAAVLAVACAGVFASPFASALDLTFNYRLTPLEGSTVTIATAHFEDVVASNGAAGIDLRLNNVASNALPGLGSTSYISGLLLAFNYSDADLPGIVVDQFADDSAQSDRWEPQEDVATVDGFTFTSELGFPRSETVSTAGWRLGVGENAHIQFLNDGSLPNPLGVNDLIAAAREANAASGAPGIMAAIKVRSVPNLTGGELIESVPTFVIGAEIPAAVPIPASLPLLLSALGGLSLFRRRR
jgi:hypothetical protein